MDDQTVRTICYLSRLRLDDEKSKKILSDLDTIIGMIDSLSSTNTDNISVEWEIVFNGFEEADGDMVVTSTDANLKECFRNTQLNWFN